MKRFLCIHGHFYQPPRENPWLEAIEQQDSAYPYHDWNERITAECYAPNGAARILDSDQRIERIVSNYERISFNFGPTLLSWLEENSRETYEAILEADRASLKRFSGHGAAIAQVYNHMILPLANRRDKDTQIVWGIRDFEHRFGRRPEGLWLSETAVDIETLDLLADHGMAFTILAPSQARRIRRIGGRSWRDVSGARIDPTMAYQVGLPSGRTIAVFFYDGPISQGVAFEGLLIDGKRFADRLMGAFSEKREWPQIIQIATDGETYGHHHRYGEMALAYALHHVDSNDSAEITIYPEYLERHPPTHEVELFAPSAWSCMHGVDRWWRDCGCSTGGHSGWNQAWRTPLREALDWLRDSLATRFEERAEPLLLDPWAARDRSIELILDRSDETRSAFFEREGSGEPSDPDRVEARMLLEMQRHAMLMFTSCGWFFEDLSGIETIQVLQYAARAIQLAREITGEDLESSFLVRLAEAKSNIAEQGDGRKIYERHVKPAMVDLQKVCGHYAIRSLFDEYEETDRIYCYTVERIEADRLDAGKPSLLVGRARLKSTITGEAADLTYGVLHFGDHNLQAGIREYGGEADYGALIEQARATFNEGGFPEVLRLLDRCFAGASYSLKSLFHDEQRRILDRLLESTLSDAEAALYSLYENHAPLMRFLGAIGSPLPKALGAAAEFVINATLRGILEEDEPDIARIQELIETARLEKITLDSSGLGYGISRAMERLMARLTAEDAGAELLPRLRKLAEIAAAAPFEVDLWRVQNQYYALARTVYPERKVATGGAAQVWSAGFNRLGALLGVRID